MYAQLNIVVYFGSPTLNTWLTQHGLAYYWPSLKAKVSVTVKGQYPWRLFWIWQVPCTVVPIEVTAQQPKVCWLHMLSLPHRQACPSCRLLVLLCKGSCGVHTMLLHKLDTTDDSCPDLPQTLTNATYRFLCLCTQHSWQVKAVFPLVSLLSCALVVFKVKTRAVQAQHFQPCAAT